ncbi:MAG: hypothetical protein WD489_08055 [Rhodovibrionaceae bacterium]
MTSVSSVSASSVVSGSGGTVFSSRSSGGSSRMSSGMELGEAFVLTLRMTLRPLAGVQGRVAIGPYRGAPQDGGYRLVILTGAGASVPAFALERQDAGGGTETLATYDGPLRIEDGQEREIRWTRDGGGEMTISIDGKAILSARDRSLAGGFDGVVLVNSGGDVEVGAIETEGAD